MGGVPGALVQVIMHKPSLAVELIVDVGCDSGLQGLRRGRAGGWLWYMCMFVAEGSSRPTAGMATAAATHVG